MYEVVVVVAVVLLIIPYIIIIIIKKNSKSFVVRPNKNVRIAKHVVGNASDTTKHIGTKANVASCRLMCNAVGWRQNAVEVK